MSKYYLAYGSNLSTAQMAGRCPDAVYVGMAEIADYQLLFKGSQTGSYLTVEPKAGKKVPVLVWRISERDERNLDRYEGYPEFYYKREITVEMKSLTDGMPLGKIDALIYIMHEERTLGCPTLRYYKVCLEGYNRFGFPSIILEQALKDSVGKRMGNAMLKEAGFYD